MRAPAALEGESSSISISSRRAGRPPSRELGFASWPALVAGVPDDARSSERAPIAHLVDEIRDVGHDYLPGRPVRVRVRVRGTNIYVDDLGGAVAVAGMPPGSLEAARQAVAELDWNVRRSGVVFMQAPRGRALDGSSRARRRRRSRYATRSCSWRTRASACAVCTAYSRKNRVGRGRWGAGHVFSARPIRWAP